MEAHPPGAAEMLDRVGMASPITPLPDGFRAFMDIEYLVSGSSFRRASTHRTMGGPTGARTDVLVWTDSVRWAGRMTSVTPPEVNIVTDDTYQETLDQYRSGVVPWVLARALSTYEYGQVARFFRFVLRNGCEVHTESVDSDTLRLTLPEWNAELSVTRATGEMVEAALATPNSANGARFRYRGRCPDSPYTARYPERVLVSTEGDWDRPDVVILFDNPELIASVSPNAFKWETRHDTAFFPATNEVVNADGTLNADATKKFAADEPERKVNPDDQPFEDLKPRRGFSPLRTSILAGAVVCGIIGLVWMIRRRTA